MMYGGGIVKEAVRASDSTKLREILGTLTPQKTLLAHIRYATVGRVRIENCHPFSAEDVTGRTWTLIHNGTIYSSSRLIPMLNIQKGDTDSERLFLCLLKTVNDAQAGGALSAAERFSLIEGFVRDLAPRNKLNLMIFDGELLYVHKNMRDTMKQHRTPDGWVFATTSLGGEDWEDVPTAQLFACRDGELAFSGQPHGGIFVPTLQYIQAMDAMNI